jgi:hypothetical protein
MMQALYLSACLFLVLTAYVWAEEDAPYPRNVTQETLSNPEALSLLQKPEKVFFQDGFELPHSLEKWFGRIGEDKRLTQVTIDPSSAHSGQAVAH